MTVDVIEHPDESKTIVKSVPTRDTNVPEILPEEIGEEAQPTGNGTSLEDATKELRDDADPPILDCYL